MKALVYTDTLTVEYRDEPEPTPRDGDALVEVVAAGICGSDMHAYHGHDARRIPPLILGHEATGIVRSGRYKGQTMAINPLIACGLCDDCVAGRTNLCAQRELIGMRLAGAFADQVCLPESNLLAIPDSLSPLHASLMEPTAVSLHAVLLVERVVHRPLSELRALVIGGGAIGLLAVLLLKAKGVSEIVVAETNAGRIETVQAAAGCHAFNPLDNVQPDENSFDVVFDAVGSGKTREMSTRFARPGSIISHIGLQDNEPGLDTRKMTLQEITFIGNYTYTVMDLKASLKVLADGALGDLAWVESQPLSAGARAFRSIHEATTASPKIVLIPENHL